MKLAVTRKTSAGCMCGTVLNFTDSAEGVALIKRAIKEKDLKGCLRKSGVFGVERRKKHCTHIAITNLSKEMQDRLTGINLL